MPDVFPQLEECAFPGPPRGSSQYQKYLACIPHYAKHIIAARDSQPSYLVVERDGPGALADGHSSLGVDVVAAIVIERC